MMWIKVRDSRGGEHLITKGAFEIYKHNGFTEIKEEVPVVKKPVQKKPVEKVLEEKQ